MMEFLKKLTHKTQPKVVTFDDQEVVRTLTDGGVERVRWDELEEVSILTTDEGPFVDDVYWLLISRTGGCAVPSSAKGSAELLPRLQRLPDFDNEAVIKAMGSTSNGRFLVWRKSSK